MTYREAFDELRRLREQYPEPKDQSYIVIAETYVTLLMLGIGECESGKGVREDG